eukprot:scaffold34615_cov26-Tisochrysis_lutea.AAC.2
MGDLGRGAVRQGRHLRPSRALHERMAALRGRDKRAQVKSLRAGLAHCVEHRAPHVYSVRSSRLDVVA